MSEIYAMPIGSKDAVNHMNNTLLNRVDMSLVSSCIKIPEPLSNYDSINVWGLVPGNSNKERWDNFEPGDIVIFVPSNYNLIITSITAKVNNAELAEKLWGLDKNNNTWELIFFVDVLSIINIGKRSFLKELKYDDNDNLMGGRRITGRFKEAYKSLNAFLEKYSYSSTTPGEASENISQEVVDSVIRKGKNHLEKLREIAENAANSSPSDYIDVSGRKIKRKAILVAYVKERDNNECQACGCRIKKAGGGYYVEVAHIKPLSLGGLDNPSNMVALCPNCHKKLDVGDDKERNDIISALKNKNGEYSGSL